MPDTKEPTFKEKGKCVITDSPKFKKGNIVIRSNGDNLTVERVIVDSARRTRRVKQPWPKDLILVVRGPMAKLVTQYFNQTALPAAEGAPAVTVPAP